ncbi:nucleotide exchange factor GrpE [Planomicrobium okeanokoites]|uniref:Protein GrpE n=1 Tax=Planomicrobium okeanokoites TaxID=244 RepID=A0ABV7KQH2_PLAOK|nr:nucleotide exchange factor GrpE [Planomicrobium okeanokoites]TAA71622.1 nucleotide exchange factor GrpE [Planomicrobium okeanokoites]
MDETTTGKQSDENAEKTTVSLKEETEEAVESRDDQSNENEGEDEVSVLKDELEAEQNKYLRLLADYDNFKRRTQKDREISAKFRSQSLLTDLLPVLDNFERALAVEAKSEDAVSIMKGVEMVQKSLLEAVKREGLEEIPAVGEPFDPNFHQAVMQEKDDDAEPGTVLQELQKGYTLKGRVLRPAMVKVNE